MPLSGISASGAVFMSLTGLITYSPKVVPGLSWEKVLSEELFARSDCKGIKTADLELSR